jgi:multidrug efflux pump subunit AcrA (membrane-fusion protein)
MNAKVEIIVDQLAEVLYVPVQSIEVEEDHHFCYISDGSKLERRPITTGVFNDEFIEVRDGLKPGELVALSLPKKATTEDARPEPNSPMPGSLDKSKPKAKEKIKAVASVAK